MSLIKGRDLRDTLSYEDSENIPTNPSDAPTLGDVINARFGRREVLRGALAVSAMAAIAGPAAGLIAKEAEAASPSFDFEEIEAALTETHAVAPGYKAEILIRWGDKVMADAPAFDPMNQSAAAQAKQFGYNNDYLGFVPLPYGSNSSEHGLLVVNQEYTNNELMFPGVGEYDDTFSKATKEIVDIEMAAHGGSIIEIKKENGS
jgi:secreted PhoX family phosphatase